MKFEPLDLPEVALRRFGDLLHELVERHPNRAAIMARGETGRYQLFMHIDEDAHQLVITQGPVDPSDDGPAIEIGAIARELVLGQPGGLN